MKKELRIKSRWIECKEYLEDSVEEVFSVFRRLADIFWIVLLTGVIILAIRGLFVLVIGK